MELLDRIEREAELAKKLSKVASKHRVELQLLLMALDHAQTPAELDKANADLNEFWERVEKETRSAIMVPIANTWFAAALLHGMEPGRALEQSAIHGAGHSATVAKQYTETSKRKVADSIDRLRRDRDEEHAKEKAELQKRIGKAREHVNGQRELPKGATKDAITRELEKLEARSKVLAPGQVLNKGKAVDISVKVFGPNRVTTVAETEIPRAQSRGSNAGLVSTGKRLIAYWAHSDLRPKGHANALKDPCEICSPLEGKPWWEWPNGMRPGEAHARCDCFARIFDPATGEFLTQDPAPRGLDAWAKRFGITSNPSPLGTLRAEESEKWDYVGHLLMEGAADLPAADAITAEPDFHQKTIGDYRKGKFLLHGLQIQIETPAGATRSGTATNGDKWSVVMPWSYGEITSLEKSQADGDPVDVFIGPCPEIELAFVVDQNKQDGTFDEHKVMLGFHSIEDARKAYQDSFSADWSGFRSITALSIPQLVAWIKTKQTDRPLAESISEATDDQEGRWVTMNGQHVFIRNGRIERGPEHLQGKNVADIEHSASTSGNTDARTNPNKKAPKGQQILDAAKKVEFTDEILDAHGIEPDDYESIEDRMDADQRREMEWNLDRQAEEWIGDQVDAADLDSEIDDWSLSNEAGWSNSSIRDNLVDKLNEIDFDTVEHGQRQRIEDAINDWHNSSNQNGIDGLDNALRHISPHASPEVMQAFNELRSQAASDIDTHRDRAIDDALDRVRTRAEEEYDSDAARRGYLRDFWHDNRELFVSSDRRDNVWGKDDSGEWVYYFNASNGSAFNIWGTKQHHGTIRPLTIGFQDERGSYNITGRGGPRIAAEVFNNVTTATTALILHEKPEIAKFTAAEPSREKLYDRLVRTTAAAVPEYRAIVGRGRTGSQYLLIRRDKVADFEQHLKENPNVNDIEILSESTTGRIRWKWLNPKHDPSWFTEAGWADEESATDQTGHVNESWDESKHPRDDDGQFVAAGAIHVAATDPNAAKKLQASVTNPVERKKLDDAIAHVKQGGRIQRPRDKSTLSKAVDAAKSAVSAVARIPDTIAGAIDGVADGVITASRKLPGQLGVHESQTDQTT